MNASLMQPYLFPYLGYFQLMAASDVFIAHDDVQYIKGGWINRNRILRQGQVQWMMLAVAGASHELPICKRQYSSLASSRGKLLRKLEGAYGKAPHFESTMELVESILSCKEENVARLNLRALKEVAAAIGITTQVLESSQLDFDHALSGPDRVRAVCEAVRASVYLNPPGGKSLYAAAFFAERNIELRFMEPRLEPYPQGSDEFVPGLSIVDVLMRVGCEGAHGLLGLRR
jgi:hypothetical protein